MLARQIPEIQSALAEAGLDGWFFACFQQNDPLGLSTCWGSPGRASSSAAAATTWCRARASRTKLVHAIEPRMLDHLPGAKSVYNTWQEHRAGVEALVAGRGGWRPSTARTTTCPPSRASTPAPSSCCAPRASSWSPPPIWRSSSSPPGPPSSSPATGAPTSTSTASSWRRSITSADALRRGDADRRVRRPALHPRRLRGRGPVGRDGPDRRRQRPQRRSALPAGPRPLGADPPGRLPAHRPLGQGEAGGQRLRRHHAGCGVCAAAPTRTPAGGLRGASPAPATPPGSWSATASRTRRCAASRWTTPPAR